MDDPHSAKTPEARFGGELRRVRVQAGCWCASWRRSSSVALQSGAAQVYVLKPVSERPAVRACDRERRDARGAKASGDLAQLLPAMRRAVHIGPPERLISVRLYQTSLVRRLVTAVRQSSWGMVRFLP